MISCSVLSANFYFVHMFKAYKSNYKVLFSFLHYNFFPLATQDEQSPSFGPLKGLNQGKLALVYEINH